MFWNRYLPCAVYLPHEETAPALTWSGVPTPTPAGSPSGTGCCPSPRTEEMKERDSPKSRSFPFSFRN